jgi:hypothetical protein
MSSSAVATTDADPRVAWFAHACQQNGVRIAAYVQSAERVGDREMAEFFRLAQREVHKLTNGAR